VVGLPGVEDAFPVSDALETGVARVPDGEIPGFGPGPEGAGQVEKEPIVCVLTRPALLSAARGEVERLERDAREPADVLDVDEQGLLRPTSSVASSRRDYP
jgi:hypothetical protein